MIECGHAGHASGLRRQAGDAHALSHARAGRASTVEENCVEHLATHRDTAVAKAAEPVARDEVPGDHGAVRSANAHAGQHRGAGALDRLEGTHRFEDARRLRAQILGAGFGPREARAIDDLDVDPGARQREGEGRTRRPAANDEYVRVAHFENSMASGAPRRDRPRRR